MPFREKVKNAFRRNSDKEKSSKPKIEYYRRGECPRSKYRGPVDPEHRRRLYDWNFAAAMEDRRRSFDLDLSPCTSLPGPRPGHESDDTAVDESDPEVEASSSLPPPYEIVNMGSITIAHHENALSGSFDTSSDQSTAVNSSCGSSSLTLKESWDWPVTRRDAGTSLKQSVQFARRISAPEKPLPFDARELTTALNAVRIVS